MLRIQFKSLFEFTEDCQGVGLHRPQTEWMTKMQVQFSVKAPTTEPGVLPPPHVFEMRNTLFA